MSEPTYRVYESPLEARAFRVYPISWEAVEPLAVVEVSFLDLLMTLAGYKVREHEE